MKSYEKQFGKKILSNLMNNNLQKKILCNLMNNTLEKNLSILWITIWKNLMKSYEYSVARSRNTMASKTNLCWSRPETLSRPLDKLWNLAWQRSRATMVSKTNLSWWLPEKLSRPLKKQDLPYIFKVENYGTSIYHVQHRHAQGSIVP